MTVNLNVPYKSQLDNENRPKGTCNVTSVAMCLNYLGIVGNGDGQLEDQLFRWVERNGYDRHVHADLVKVFEHYGFIDRFETEATWKQVRAHLDKGYPVIYAGMLSGSGHIIVLRGYDETGYFVNDPYGEWFSWGYDTDVTGENLHYSQHLLSCCSMTGDYNTTWAHFPSKKVKPAK